MVDEWSVAKKWNPFNSYKLLAQVYRWRLIKEKESIPQPSLVTIDPINVCNLKCEFCLRGGEKVMLTDTSYKNIEDIVPGDEVIGFDLLENTAQKQTIFKPAKVKNIFKRKATELIRLKTNDSEIYITPNHKLLTPGKRWRLAGNLKVNDKVCSLPFYEKSNSDDYMLGWLRGIADGDGSFWSTIDKRKKHGNSRRQFRVSSLDKEYLSIFLYNMKKLGFSCYDGIHRTTSKTSFDHKDRQYYAIWLTKHEEVKKFENINKEESIDFIHGWLGGMFDTDGSYSGSIRISQLKPWSVKKLIRFLNKTDFKYVKEKTGVRLLGNRKEKLRFLKLCGSNLSRKYRKILTGKINNTAKITEITKIIHNDYVYNIETETNNYFASGFVVHNCNAHKILEDNKNMMSKELLLNIADFLKEWQGSSKWEKGVESCCIAGGGEPLLNPHISDFINRCVANGIEVGVVTNGTLIDKHIDALSKCTWVGVSVDAGTEKTFKDIKGVDAFQKVLKNIRILADYAKKYNTRLNINRQGYGVSYKYLLTPKNVGEIFLAANYAKELGCKNFHMRPVGVPWDEVSKEKRDIFLFTHKDTKTFEEQTILARELETEKFGVFGVTHKFDNQFEKSNQFKKCHAVFMTAVFMPSKSGNKDAFDLGLCCDRRGDDRLLLAKNIADVKEINKLWGSKLHWKIQKNIKVGTCPRCVPEGEQILTKSGLKNIEDITTDDMVISTSGKFQKVTKTYKRNANEPILDIYIVGSNIPISITENHTLPYIRIENCSLKCNSKRNAKCFKLCSYMRSAINRTKTKQIWCNELYKNMQIQEKEAKNLVSDKDFLLIPKLNTETTIKIPDDYFVLAGYYLSEGWLSKGRGYGVSFGLHKKEEHIKKNIEEIIKTQFGAHLNKTYYSKKSNAMEFSFYSKQAYEFLEQFGNGAHNKRLPEWIWNASLEQTCKLLSAYIEGDGCVYKNIVIMDSVSKELLLQIRTLLTKFNIPSTFYKSKRTTGGTIDGRVIKYKDSSYALKILTTNNSAGHNSFIDYGDYWLVKIRKIEKRDYCGNVYNLEVDKEHKYTLNGVLVNNCTYSPHNQIFEHVIENDSMTYKFI